MSSRPLNLRSDPKFLARVKKIESKANTRIILHPIDIPLKNGVTAIIAAIGINGCYLAVVPGKAEDGRWIDSSGRYFSVWWTDKKSTAYEQTEIQRFMSMWIITSEENNFKIVPHRDIDAVKIAIEAITKRRGPDFWDKERSTILVVDQGVEREVRNPAQR